MLAPTVAGVLHLQGYRNKCEFTISLGADGLATTGFRAGRFNADMPITVESPKDCPQVILVQVSSR